MPRILAASDSTEFSPLAEGDYLFVIMKVTEEQGKNPPHNAYFHMQLQEPVSKKNVWDNLVFSDGSAFRVTNFWRALGHDVKKGDPIDIETHHIAGLWIRAHVSVGEWNGKPTNNVDYYVEPEESLLERKTPTKKALQPF